MSAPASPANTADAPSAATPSQAVLAIVARVDARRKVVINVTCWLGLALAALIALGEVDRLIAAVLGDDRASNSLSSVIGPLAFTARDAWGEWSSALLHADVGVWIIWSIVLDAIFIVAYVFVLLKFIRRRTSAANSKGTRSEIVLWILVAVEGLEAIALGMGAGQVISGAEGGKGTLLYAAGWAVLVLAMLKWATFAVLVVEILRNAGTRKAVRSIVVRTAQALWLHRLSVVVVALLFVLACIPQDGVLDQLPDIQRQWIGTGVGFLHFIAAMVSIVIAAIAAFALGRARTRRGIACYVEKVKTADDEVRNTIWWWLIPPAAWVVVAAITIGLSAANDIPEAEWFSLPTILFFWGILVVVIGFSVVFRKREWVTKPISSEPERAVYAWLVGDLLAIAVFVVGGLGMVRSMAAPVFLGPVQAAGYAWIPALGLFLLGAGIAVLSPLLLFGVKRGAPWKLLKPLVNRNDPTESRAAGTPEFTPHVRALGIIIGVGIAILIAVTLVPVQLAAALGPVALTVVLVTAWTAVLGAFTVAIQDYRPLALFRMMHLSATPVLTLAITIPLIYSAIVSTTGGDPVLHAVRQINSEDAYDVKKPSGSTKVTELLEVKGSCTVKIGEQEVQPVVLIAAEGGGIRAAYWTVRALNELREKHPCIAESVVVSSGVSGGSVGLVLTATDAVTGAPAIATPADAGEPDDVDATWTNFAGPHVVGSAAAALLAGDVVGAALGIHAPSYYHGDAFAWRDRAALIEHGWIDAATVLDEAYDPSSRPLTGFMLLNSTDTNSGCRIVVGMDGFAAGSKPPDCTATGDTPATSWWLGEKCQVSLDWASAAMLSARFPVVTPGGQMSTVDGCSDAAQLIDGGYSEGTGLGTIADLAPAILGAVREANADPARTVPLMPIVVYLRNSSGLDIVDPLGDLTAEPLVPLVGFAAASKQLSDVSWLQRLAASLEEACPAPPAGSKLDCENVLSTARKTLGNGIVVVAPGTTPTVVPPLGWALSAYSVASLDRALKAESDCEKGSRGAVAGAARMCDLPRDPS